MSLFIKGRSWIEESPDDEEETDLNGACCRKRDQFELNPFRNRASTDGNLASRPRKWHYPVQNLLMHPKPKIERRMSISMRGSNSSS